MNRRRYLFIVACILAAGSGLLFWHDRNGDLPTRTREIAACKEAKNPTGCARPIVQTLIKDHRASEIIHAMAAATPTKSDCHEFSHVVGEQVYAKYKNTERALAECDSTCGLACLHGATGEAFQEEGGLSGNVVDPEHLTTRDIQKLGESLCKTSNACHGVGHVLFRNLQSIPQALDICWRFTIAPYIYSACYTGVFMEYDSEIAGASLWNSSIKPDPPPIASLNHFCDSYSGNRAFACYWYLPFITHDTYLVNGIEKSWSETTALATDLCEGKEGWSRRYCVFGVGAYQYLYVAERPRAAERVCERFSNPGDKASCIYGATSLATGFARPEALVAYCSAVRDLTIRFVCFKNVMKQTQRTPDLHQSVDDITRLCSWSDPTCYRAAKALEGYVWDDITAAYPL